MFKHRWLLPIKVHRKWISVVGVLNRILINNHQHYCILETFYSQQHFSNFSMAHFFLAVTVIKLNVYRQFSLSLRYFENRKNEFFKLTQVLLGVKCNNTDECRLKSSISLRPHLLKIYFRCTHYYLKSYPCQSLAQKSNRIRD